MQILSQTLHCKETPRAQIIPSEIIEDYIETRKWEEDEEV